MTGPWCAGQLGYTPLDIATNSNGVEVVFSRGVMEGAMRESALRKKVRALVGNVSNLCLHRQLFYAPDSTPNNALRKLGRALL